MAELSRTASIQGAFEQGGLRAVFVEQLGWESSTGSPKLVEVDGARFNVQVAASLKGFKIYEVMCDARPTRRTMRLVDSALAQLSPERLAVFQSTDSWFWQWPRRTPAGAIAHEAVETAIDSLPAFLAQRLTGLEFTAADHRRGLTLTDVRDRIHGHFDATNVTRKFYERFQQEHNALANAIQGLPSERASTTEPSSLQIDYATTLLNRLMFLYFMQKKEFLNGDPRYLENTLRALQELRGRDQYYGFYRDALLPLFFDKLNERDGSVADAEVAKILGDVPYINGGIFGRTDLEVQYHSELVVPDAAFESILRFFAEFNWHLDTRPTGNPNEINPEVIGYIFEQYINFSTSGKKEHGAYYTAHDVTAHMVAQTLVPRVIEYLPSLETIFDLLRAEPDRYIQPAMLYGWNANETRWESTGDTLQEAWLGDPAGWDVLDSAPEHSPAQLAAETWVETFHRRDRVESLRERILSGAIAGVNDLVTENLNGQLLLTDAIDRSSDATAIADLFDKLTSLSVFDPTCGSGAFLFAALESLEDIYAHIIDAARGLADDPAVAELLAQVDSQPSTRYFIRKHIAIRNLYGTDLMPGAIETAKLRIFLSLAACVDSREQLQPLPDLDFNLKVGNLVVGFKDSTDVERVGADILTAAQLIALEPRIDEYSKLYDEFVEAVETAAPDLADKKATLARFEQALRRDSNEIYADATHVPAARVEDWISTVRPFHWFCEFPAVHRRGGFDVIIGNPPYVRMSQLPGYTTVGYKTSGCPDLFAVCYERSLSLLAPTGRHAFIVMAAMAISEEYRPLRQVIAERDGSEWWSTFGRIPAGLFPPNVRVRNTILVLGPGRTVMTTRHHLHKTIQRPWLFPTLEFAPADRAAGAWPVRGGVATPILQRIAKLAVPAGAPTPEIVYVRPTATYWMPVLPGPAPVLDGQGGVIEVLDAGLKQVPLVAGESVMHVVALAGGKFGYLWWALVGDDFHVGARDLSAIRALAKIGASADGWESAVEMVLGAVEGATFMSVNAKKFYFNVRWNNLRKVTDVLDRLALSALGGDDEDWRSINVLYRQVMRSSGDSAKGRYVTSEEYESFLGW